MGYVVGVRSDFAAWAGFRQARVPKGARQGWPELIPLTVPEVQKLLLRLVWACVPEPEPVLAWSEWRQWHQHRARRSHYRRRGARPMPVP
ncbi:hypothetical protein [Gemmata massiliana]|uniref:hypothetical protein n=1 Tax=Gemmata massiliana TaxID=1210884 RepID=UPI0013A6CFE5|nr:hypothetical protein [Gemmata massiliana]